MLTDLEIKLLGGVITDTWQRIGAIINKLFALSPSDILGVLTKALPPVTFGY